MRLISSLAAGALVAALLTMVGTRDMENYELAFFSLNRGTAVEAVEILGHPVYTLAIGLGVRLPLQGNLGASPAAALASLLPGPVTYWMLIAMAISAAIMVVRSALEPLCGRLIAWIANALLFCSAPMVSYTVYNDWPETAITYCALVGCVFAPLSFLALLRVRATGRRRLAALALTAMVSSFVATAHPGYWLVVLGSLGVSMTLAFQQPEHAWHRRLTLAAGLTVAAVASVLISIPDLAHEMALGAGFEREVEGPVGNVLLANLFPFVPVGNRLPFTFFFLAATALAVGATTPDRLRRSLILGSGLISLLLSVAASTLQPGSFLAAPSTTWSLRDPAIAFAVLSAAVAASVLRRTEEREGPTAPVARGRSGLRIRAMCRVMIGLLLLFAIQGPMYAATLVWTWTAPREGDPLRGNHDFSKPERRVVLRGMPEQLLEPRSRIALWPGVRADMRYMGRPSTDFADAGYRLVTARTKNRTMAGLVEPNRNPVLFDQTTDLDSDVLCDPDVVRFLQLRYLLVPPDRECRGWTALPGVLVDGRWAVAVSPAHDHVVRGVRLAHVPEQWRSEPALSADSALVTSLVAFAGTSLTIEPDRLILELTDAARSDGLALVLPVAYDPGWQTSAGHVQEVGGLLVLVEANAPKVHMEFRPDARLRIRAIGMTVLQALGLLGFLTLGFLGWPVVSMRV